MLNTWMLVLAINGENYIGISQRRLSDCVEAAQSIASIHGPDLNIETLCAKTDGSESVYVPNKYPEGSGVIK